jgi:hypothetical protein
MHTPGPWNIDRYPDRLGSPQAIVLAGEELVCELDTGFAEVEDNWEDNLNLIATAPELLDHLDSIIKSYDNGDLEAWEIELARNVVAKAEGK